MRRGAGRAAPWLLAVGMLSRCNLYEGRSLDLFQPAIDLASECRDSKDCPRDRQFCARNSCVQCLLDADCDRRHPACVGNVCVECRASADCSAGQNCNSVLELCAPSCTLGSDCTGPDMPRCSSELDLCVQCTEDLDCAGRKEPVCGRGGRCVGCRSDTDCNPDAGKPSCNLTSQRCEECSGDASCSPAPRPPAEACDAAAPSCAPAPPPPPASMMMPAPPPGARPAP
jgi:Cys-rich repeat protein